MRGMARHRWLRSQRESRRRGGAAWPAASSAGAHRRGPLPAPPFPRTRNQPGSPPLRTFADRACTSGWAVLLAPGILPPRKDHRQGRARRRVACGDGASATLDTDLPRQESGTYQEDGPTSTRPSSRALSVPEPKLQTNANCANGYATPGV